MRRLLLLLALAGCTQTTTTPPSAPTVHVGTPVDTLPLDHPPIGSVGGTGGSGGGQGGIGGGAATPTPPGYGARRLQLSQVEASIKTIFGTTAAGAPITWRTASTDGFAARAETLQVPDYIERTEEPLEASPLFLKFMSDMARSVCNQAVAADTAAQRPATMGKVLYRHVNAADTVASARDAVDQNLRHLRLVFHGIKVQPGEDAPIAPLRALFSDVVLQAAGTATPNATHVAEGWRTVCVALVTAPEFLLY